MPLSTIRVANNCFSRARNILNASTSDQIARGTREDFRRLALVMSVVALDAYVHWTVFLKLSDVRRQANIPKGLQKLEISFGDVALIVKNAVTARRMELDFRPWVQVKNAVQKRLLRMTMQSSQDVAEALSLVGVREVWRNVASRLNLPAQDVKTRLDQIVARRNQIVHEGDLPRRQRPRRIKHNSIRRLDVSNDIDFMENLIKVLHEEIEAQF